MNLDFKIDQITDQINSGSKILILDDDPDVLSSLRDLLSLEDRNYYVETASNIPELQAILEYFTPDLALIDIKVQGRDGLDLLPVLKIRFPDIVCIVITGHKDAEFAVKALRHGADNYLYKPLDSLKLLLTIEQSLSKQRYDRAQDEIDQRLRAIFDKVFHLIFVLDKDGDVLDINNTSNDILYAPKHAVIGQKIWDSSVLNINALTSRRLKNLVSEARTGKSLHTEVDLKATNGEVVVLDFYIKPLSYENKKVESFLVECSDITDRKEVEKRLQELLYFDSQTHLPKGEFFSEQLELERAKAQRNNSIIGISLVSVNNLHHISVEHGFKFQGQLINEIANRIKNIVGHAGTVLRNSEDTFIIIHSFAENSPEVFAEFSENLLNSISKDFSVGKNTAIPQVNLGLGVLSKANGVDTENLLNRIHEISKSATTPGSYQISILD